MKLLLTVAMLVALAFGGGAVAQQTCGTHASMIAQLNLKYGETRHGIGLSGLLSAFEVWVSDETGTWTILKVFPSGQACMMASGEGWQTDPPVVPGDPV